MKRGRWKCLYHLSYHLSFHVREIRQEKLTQPLPFRGSLTDRDYVLQEISNQTCWKPRSCFHFAAVGCARVCAREMSLMRPELQSILELCVFYDHISLCTGLCVYILNLCGYCAQRMGKALYRPLSLVYIHALKLCRMYAKARKYLTSLYLYLCTCMCVSVCSYATKTQHLCHCGEFLC